MSAQSDRRRAALNRMAKDDPELAARLILMTLPGAASKVDKTMSYVLDVEELGAHRVSISGGRARVDRVDKDGDEDVDFRLQANADSVEDAPHPLLSGQIPTLCETTSGPEAAPPGDRNG